MLPRPARVLIADDTADLRLIMRLALSRVDGVEVVAEAVDGLDAVQKAIETRPDLVLLDLAMPRMGGLEALSLLRERVPDAQVVVLSAYAEDDVAEQALAAGAFAYAQKTGRPAELVEIVDRALGRRGDGAVAPAPAAAAPRPAVDLDRALGRIAHDLCNPAIALAMIADRMEQDAGAGRPAAAELIGALRRQVDAIDQITMDLLTAAQARRGALAVSPRRLDLAAALSAAAALRPDAGVTVDCPAGEVVTADPTRLEQLLLDLVANAQRHGAPPLLLTGRVEGGHAVVEMIDHGPGVPAAFVPRLFDEYTQAEPDRGAGVGLGLYVVQAIAHAHGGRASYERRGEATVFRVELPLR